MFEGLPREECIAQHPQVWAGCCVAGPMSEPHAVVLERMQRGLAHTVALMRGHYTRGLVVSHGSSLRMFLESLTGAPVPLIGNMEFREVLHDGTRFLQRAQAEPDGAKGGP